MFVKSFVFKGVSVSLAITWELFRGIKRNQRRALNIKKIPEFPYVHWITFFRQFPVFSLDAVYQTYAREKAKHWLYDFLFQSIQHLQRNSITATDLRKVIDQDGNMEKKGEKRIVGIRKLLELFYTTPYGNFEHISSYDTGDVFDVWIKAKLKCKKCNVCFKCFVPKGIPIGDILFLVDKHPCFIPNDSGK